MSTIPEDTLKKTIIRELETVLEDEQLHDCEVSIKAIPCTGRNYTGALFGITLKDSKKGTLELFAKIANINEYTRSKIPAQEMYKRERFLYKEIADIYKEIQNKHKIPEEKRFTFPKFYASCSRPMEELIILENLCAKNYVVGDRFKTITWDYAAKCIDELSKFHALSFALQRDYPKYFEEKVVTKEEFVTERLEDPEREKYQEKLFASFVEILGVEKWRRVEVFISSLTRGVCKSYNKPQRRPVLVHGDYRQSNLMTKYQENQIVDVVPVDYQTVYYGSPINDILYFIFTGTDEEFRAKHYEQIFEHYYSCLKNNAADLNIDVKYIYPKTDFEEDIKERTPYGLIMTLFILPYILVDEKPDLNINLKDISLKHGNTFKQRFIGIINDYMKWGYL